MSISYYKNQLITNLADSTKINYKAYYHNNILFGANAEPTPDTGETISHPYNEIWYTTTNNVALTPNLYNFNEVGTLVSNTYEDGKGILTFASDVQKVGGYAFSGNTTLKTIEFPDSLLWFDGHPFQRCSGLESVKIGNNLYTTGGYTFSGCSSLSSVTISATIPPTLGSGTFTRVKRNGVLTYQNGSTYANSNWLNNSSTYYPKYYNWSGNATGDTASVLSVRLTLNNSTTTDFSYVGGIIPESAYTSYSATCTSAELVSATTINNYAFRDCTAMTSVTINYGVHTICENAFFRCSSLTSITIPDSVYWLRNYAFQGCTNLENIHIGKGVHRIGHYNTNSDSNGNSVFYNCKKISAITVDSSNTFFDSRNNCNAIILTSKNRLIMGCINTVIPNTVTSIGANAFDLCSGLTSINIPSSVTNIGDGAFQYSPIASFNYNGTVEQWENVTYGDFWGDDWATNVVHCTNGDACLFSCRGIADNQIQYTTTNRETTEPTQSVFTVVSNDYTDGVGTMEFDSNLESLDEHMLNFNGNETLESVNLPDSVYVIDTNAFGNCTSLTSITFGENFSQIGFEALQGCTSLTDMYFYVNSDTWVSLDTSQTDFHSGGTIHLPSDIMYIDSFEEFANTFGWSVVQDL